TPRARGARSRATPPARPIPLRRRCCLCALPWIASERAVADYIRSASRARAVSTAGGPEVERGKLRPALLRGDVIEAAAHPVEPPHRLAIGPDEDGAVVDDDLHVALVVLDRSSSYWMGSPAFGSPQVLPRSRRRRCPASSRPAARCSRPPGTHVGRRGPPEVAPRR